MSFIKDHGPKVLLGAVAIGCGVFAWLDSSGGGMEAKSGDLDANVEKIKKLVASRTVSEKYAFGHEAMNNLKYQDEMNAAYERATKRFDSEIPANVAYQTPARPFVDQAKKPTTLEDVTTATEAEIREIADVKASGDHGRVFVSFKVPAKMKYMEAQRVEIFRGESEKEINMKAPYATIEFMPEESGSTAAVKEKDEPEKTAASDEPESAAAKRRRERAGGEDAPKTGRDKKPVAPAPAEIPAEYADVKVFADTHVEPKQTYFYKLRLVGKMTLTPGQKIMEKDNKGLVSKITVVNAPKNAQAVPPAKPGSTTALFSTPISASVSATPPSNFEIRLAGTSGKLDPPGTPEFKRGKEYKGNFAVRVWVTEAQVWKEITIQASPEERLKGVLMYKDAETKGTKNVDFDAGYKLVEIKWGEIVRESKVEEAEVDANGNQVIDPKTGQSKKKEVIKKSDPIPNEIAVLEDLTSHKNEEFPKRNDFGAREKALEYYARIVDEQQKADKAFKVKMDKVRERIKTDDDTRKQKADAAAAAAGAEASAPATTNPGGGGVGGGGGGRAGGGAPKAGGGGKEKR